MLKKVLFLSLASLILAGCSLLPANTEDISPTGASIPLTIKDGQGSRITLTSPLADQVLTSPFLVAGNTDINTDKVYVRVKNPSGEGVIDAWTAIKSSLDDIGSFSVFIDFNFRGTKAGTVEVYSKDENGDEIGNKIVPVKFVVE